MVIFSPAPFGGVFGNKKLNKPSAIAVSYTHLDVYKRQVYKYIKKTDHQSFKYFICSKNLSLHLENACSYAKSPTLS